MINGMTTLFDKVNFTLRLYDLYWQGKEVLEKIKNYNPNTWGRREYAQVVIEGGYVVSSAMIMKLELEESQKPVCNETREKTLKTWEKINCGFFLGKELLMQEQRTVIQMLLNEKILWRLSVLAAKHGHPQLGGGLHMLAMGAYLKRWFEWALTDQSMRIERFIPSGDHGDLVFPKTLNYSMIPTEYEDDPVFKLYQCSITQTVITVPVAIVEGDGKVHLFELGPLVAWLNSNPIDPVTREPLPLGDVQINVRLLRKIQERMRALGIPLI